MKNGVAVLEASAPNAGLIKDSPMEIVVKNKLRADEQANVSYLQYLYLRNLVTFTVHKIENRMDLIRYGELRDRKLMGRCNSEELLCGLLKQMELKLERLGEERLKRIRRLEYVLWFMPIFGWIILCKNRKLVNQHEQFYHCEVFSNLSLLTLNIKRRLEKYGISTEKLIRDYSNNTLAKEIWNCR